VKLTPNSTLPKPGDENVLVTSALPYVNNVPHLGNIIGCVLSADVYSRFKKLQGANTLYICGTDEYGTATEVKAMEEKKTPKEICDHYFKIHSDVYKWFDIGFDYFGRTSTEWHTKIVQDIFLHVHKNDRIQSESMTQCFCENCQMFLADRFIVGNCPHCDFNEARGDQCDKCQKLFNSPTELKNYSCNICRKQPIIKETTHLFIKLPEIVEELKAWIAKASAIWSPNSTNITNGWINMGLKTKCITRDLKWGVPVPLEEFKDKVFYVWFDAPIGYISITAEFLQEHYKDWWQNENVRLYQFMGKDNVPFHTVIFPSSLIASKQGWTLLHHISTTEYLNYESGKFSKTHGTGVFGNNAVELEHEIPSEVWRYYLLVNRPETSDSEFCWKDFSNKNNNELLANLGNLVHRALQFIYKEPSWERKIPKIKIGDLNDADMDFI
jgi:methionyl-tRNA synthetase